MTRRFPTLTDAASIGVGLLIIATGAAVALAGPETLMPVHYGATGQADRWGSKVEVGLLIGGLGLVLLLVCGLIGLVIHRTPDLSRQRALRLTQVFCLVVLTAVAILMGGTMLGDVRSVGTVLPMAFTSLIVLALGSFMGRVQPNPVMGVRTPWSYKSRLAWDRSNRLAGRLFFLIGLAGLAAAGFAPQPAGLYVLIGAILLAALASVFESWRVWRDDPERQPF